MVTIRHRAVPPFFSPRWVIDSVEPAFEEVLIGLELERVRHDARGIREHAIL